MQALFAFFFIIIVIFLVLVFLIAALGFSFILNAVRILLSPFRRKGGVKDVVTGADSRVVTDVMVKDPVCGTYVPMGDAVRKTIGGRTLYFCSQECLSQYKKEA
jgi:YHS domain-containing protein